MIIQENSMILLINYLSISYPLGTILAAQCHRKMGIWKIIGIAETIAFLSNWKKWVETLTHGQGLIGFW